MQTMPLLQKKLEEVNNPLKKIVQKQPTKKNLIYPVEKFQSFLLLKDFFLKKMMFNKKNFYQLRPFDCQKSLTNAICEKYLD